MEIFPNPCSDIVRIRYKMQDAGYRMVEVYSISGKKIRRAFEGEKGPGTYEEILDVHDLPAGVYFIRLQAGREVAVRKLIVTK
ncbi:MAG: T9SS type A sorting domain-containing protein [Bacteroidota bacterium]|nr:T9SS type A sorting domain-containing protein [Bacteroidota bacterium]